MPAPSAASDSPAPVSPALLAQLARIFPPERILSTPEHLLAYSYDGTAALQSLPAVVVLAKTPQEISALLKLANGNSNGIPPPPPGATAGDANKTFPVITRGSGTGLSGGTVPVVPGSVVLCTAQMDTIIETDAANLTLLAEAGAITQKIAEAASAAGLFYPPDPGSGKISTIGGNVAENSGGLRGLKYGVTRDYVMGVEVVLPNGDIAWFGSKCVKDVAGYSMRDIFIGSEGTLGVITKVLLKLVPKPAAKRTLLALYNTMEAAADTVSAIIAQKIIPCTLEFLDQTTVRCVEDYAHIGLPTDAAAVLLMETDGPASVVEAEAAAMRDIALARGATSVQIAADEAESQRLAAARRVAFSALARVSPTTILEDATVPRSELAKMVRFCRECADRHHLRVGIFGHMGDGNLHPTFLTDERNTEEMHRVEAAMKEIFDYALSLGGTITGEHGVGVAKKAFLTRQYSNASMDAMRVLKRAFDPAGVLNPGKIFDL
ncbi:FAD-linked oxidase C-terminal domain-containing protein [Geminisphaera colitermitum]|uniref:FAD-linked oxidase C-terminal domain-containing protein n=1 Tax=Geminisphaera colitermitum TaxID=1148786 RepID=UPI0005BCE9B9